MHINKALIARGWDSVVFDLDNGMLVYVCNVPDCINNCDRWKVKFSPYPDAFAKWGYFEDAGSFPAGTFDKATAILEEKLRSTDIPDVLDCVPRRPWDELLKTNEKIRKDYNWPLGKW